MRFVLEIDELDNAAFERDPAGEVSRILHTLPRERIDSAYRERDLYGGDDNRLKDVNGNTVGRYRFDEEEK